MSVPETIAVVRDIAFLSVLLAVMFISLTLYWKASALMGSGKRIAKDTEDMVSTLSIQVVGSAGENLALASNLASTLASGAGKTASLLLWPTRSWQRAGLTGLTGLAGLAVLAWAKNWLGIRGGTESEDSFEGSGEDASTAAGNNT